MKKSIITLFLMAAAQVGMAQVIEVRTAQELKTAVQNDSRCNIKLMSDIDMGGSGINATFSGTLDGLRQIDGKDAAWCISNLGGPLFSALADATITNLHLSGVSYTVNDKNTPRSGALANSSQGSHFTNVEVSNSYIYIDSNGGNEEGSVGGLLGYAKECQFENVKMSHTEVISDEFLCGGIIGVSDKCGFVDCLVDEYCSIFCDGMLITVYDQEILPTSTAYTGGICGKDKDGTFSRCVNLGLVAADGRFIGGLVGWSTFSKFTDCMNAGPVMCLGSKDIYEGVLLSRNLLEEEHFHYGNYTFPVLKLSQSFIDKIGSYEYVGGIVGKPDRPYIWTSVNFGPYCTKGENAGGIAGGYAAYIHNCLNMPSATDPFPDTEYHGGISGDLDSEMSSCLNLNGTRAMGGDGSMPWEKRLNYTDIYSNSSSSYPFEMQISDKMLASGALAWLLNDSPYNVSKGIAPWHQNFTTNTPDGGIIDGIPYPSDAYGEVQYDEVLSRHTISTADELMAFSEDVYNGNNPCFAQLACDIDLNGKEWRPIGSAAHPFFGIFDGNGHAIHNLDLSIEATLHTDNSGFFGVLGVHTTICNLIIASDARISTAVNGVAGIAGAVLADKQMGLVNIRCCGNEADIIGQTNVAGILGRVFRHDDNDIRLTIENCYNTGNLYVNAVTQATGTSESALICAYTGDNASVRGCWNTGDMSFNEFAPSYDDLVANHKPWLPYKYFVNTGDECRIENCYSLRGVCEDEYQPQAQGFLPRDLDNGRVTFMLNGNTNDVSLSLPWQQSLGTDSRPYFGTKGLSLTRSVSNTCGTLCLPYPVQSEDDIRYYLFRESRTEDGVVKLCFDYTDDVVPAGTPVLFCVRNTGDVTFSGAAGKWSHYPIEPASSQWEMWGTFSQQQFSGTDAESIYYISGGEICNAQTVTIAPYRAYFHGPNINTLLGSGQARVSLMIDGVEDETSALQLIADDVVAGGSKAYTLFGTEASEGYRGITIRNGKKVLQ